MSDNNAAYSISAPPGSGASPLSDQMRRWLNSPFVVALLIAIIFGGFTKWRVSASDNDLTYFIVAGSQIVDGTQTPNKLRILSGISKGGYDGQYVYRLALNPLTRKKVDYGVNLDAPGYRQARILLPTLAYALSGGDPARIPAALIWVNVVCVWGVGIAAVWYTRELRVSPWWAMLVALYPGFLLTLARDLTEVVGACFLLLGLLFLRRAAPLPATICLCLAVLGRDTAIFAAGAVAAAWVWGQAARRNWVPPGLQAWVMGASEQVPRLPGYVAAVPIAMYLGWLCYLRSVWGKFPQQEYIAPFEPTFIALFRFLNNLLWGVKVSTQGPLPNLWLTQCLILIAFALVTLVLWRRTRANLVERIAWILYGALASFYGEGIWLEDYAFLRVLSEFWLLTTILFVASPFRHKAVLATLALMSFWLTFLSFSWR